MSPCGGAGDDLGFDHRTGLEFEFEHAGGRRGDVVDDRIGVRVRAAANLEVLRNGIGDHRRRQLWGGGGTMGAALGWTMTSTINRSPIQGAASPATCAQTEYVWCYLTAEGSAPS